MLRSTCSTQQSTHRSIKLVTVVGRTTLTTLATVDVPRGEKAENRPSPEIGTNLGTLVSEIPEFFCIKVLDKSKKVSMPKPSSSRSSISTERQPAKRQMVKGKGSPYSITERRVPELIPVLGSQPARDVSHKPDGRLPLLSAKPTVTPATLERAVTPAERHSSRDSNSCYVFNYSIQRYDTGCYFNMQSCRF